MMIVELQIIPVPLKIWDLKIGDRFCLEPTGWNFEKERFEVYLKLTRTKALLDSLEEKPVLSIPKISRKDVGYKVVESWKKSKERLALF